MTTKLPNTPVSLFRLMTLTVGAYFTIFPRIILLVVLSAAVHGIVPWLFILNPAYGFVGLLGFVLFTWFLYTAVLNSAHVALQGGHLPIANAFAMARKRYLFVLGSNILFFAIGLFALLIEYALNLTLDIFHEYPLSLWISLILDVYVFVLLYFAIPVIILENTAIFPAFERSFFLVRHHWLRSFIALGLVGLAILGCEALGILLTGKSRLLLFTAWHFGLQVIFYPLIVAVTLVLYNDLKLRFEWRQKRLAAYLAAKKHQQGHA